MNTSFNFIYEMLTKFAMETPNLDTYDRIQLETIRRMFREWYQACYCPKNGVMFVE